VAKLPSILLQNMYVAEINMQQTQNSQNGLSSRIRG